jgi:transcriptional regulator with XRE-family HTH domain
METLGDRIKMAREAAGLTQSALASALQTQWQQVSRWERGQAIPRSPTVTRIAEETCTTPVWLRTGDEPKHPGTLAGVMARDFGMYPNHPESAKENITTFQAPLQPIDLALLESAMLTVLQLLHQRKLTLSPERTVAGIMAVYEAARAQGRSNVTEGDVTPLVRLFMA